jgi:Tol biopolymer transport system component
MVAAALGAGVMVHAQAPRSSEVQLKAAQHRAEVEGDLKGAIEEYRKIVAGAGGNRAVAAEALVRMAECYQKLGDIEAQAIYARIIREYADQNAAVGVARARLRTTESAARVRGDRTIWSDRNADGFGTISPDGRFLTYTDWQTGALMLRDIEAGSDHRLTAGTYEEGSTQFSAISKDGKQVAYQWLDNKRPPDSNGSKRYDLRVARLQPGGLSEPRRLVDLEDIAGAAPYDWSPDGKWIAVFVSRSDLTGQIALVGTSDGSLRVLKSTGWKEPTKIFFSPDGKYIAYDLMVDDNSDERHVFVMAVDGARESEPVAHASQNVIMGWSPDGRHLLFASNRSGSFGLWAVPVADGKAAGMPALVKSDVSSTWSLGMTASGTMYVWKYASPVYVQVSSIDLTAGRLATSAPAFQRFITSRGRPEWSQDGKRLAYQSCAPLGAGPCTLWIRSIETGAQRELRTKLGYFFFPRWSPDGRELLVRGNDLRGRNNGLYRIDAESGEVTLVATPFPGDGLPQWAADGKHAYYRRQSSIIERDLASGTEREAVGLATSGAVEFAASPDDRFLAYVSTERTGTTLSVMPMAGGPARVLLAVSAPERFVGRLGWTAEGRALVIAKQLADNRNEIWLVPVTDERPRKLDIDVEHWMLGDGFRLDRAGKQIAFVAAAGKAGLEIRALENFLPAPTPKKQTARK